MGLQTPRLFLIVPTKRCMRKRSLVLAPRPALRKSSTGPGHPELQSNFEANLCIHSRSQSEKRGKREKQKGWKEVIQKVSHAKLTNDFTSETFV